MPGRDVVRQTHHPEETRSAHHHFIDQPDVIKKILQHLGLWEESHAPPERDLPMKQIASDSSTAS
jgi:hypothetical protein